MAVPGSKDELLDAITKTFDRLREDFTRVPKERAREATMQGHVAGEMMSPADLAAYLIGWNELVLKWIDRDDQGEAVDFPETGFRWNELGLLAEKFYADYEPFDWPKRLELLEAAKEKLVSTISMRSNDELYGKGWYGKWTKGRMIQFNTSSPYANARARIRKWLKANS